jgi:hypothetical protein
MRSYDNLHPKGTKYSKSELFSHRDNWYNKIKLNALSSPREAHIQADTIVAKKILRALPWDPAIKILTEHDFLSPFLAAHIQPIVEFDCERDNPEFEFFDSDLEAGRAELISAIWKFRELSIIYNFPLGPSLDLLGLPKEFETFDRKPRHECAQELNTAGRNVGEVYKKFIRTLRLKIPFVFIDT